MWPFVTLLEHLPEKSTASGQFSIHSITFISSMYFCQWIKERTKDHHTTLAGRNKWRFKTRNRIRKKLFLMFHIITKLNMNSITKIESGWYTSCAKINAQSSAFLLQRKENTLFSFSWFLQNYYFWLHVKCDYFTLYSFGLRLQQSSVVLYGILRPALQFVNKYDKFRG